MRSRNQAFAIVRVDDFLGQSVPCHERVAVKEVVWTQEHAEAEVARLTALNSEKNVTYFWRATRVQPTSGEQGTPGE
jgi:hypothetical protein